MGRLSRVAVVWVGATVLAVILIPQLIRWERFGESESENVSSSASEPPTLVSASPNESPKSARRLPQPVRGPQLDTNPPGDPPRRMPPMVYGFVEDMDGNIHSIMTTPDKATEEAAEAFAAVPNPAVPAAFLAPPSAIPDQELTSLPSAELPTLSSTEDTPSSGLFPPPENNPSARATLHESEAVLPNLSASTQEQQPLPVREVSPDELTAEIMRLRTQLGGGVSETIADPELKKLAEQAFAEELQRLQQAGNPTLDNHPHAIHGSSAPPVGPVINVGDQLPSVLPADSGPGHHEGLWPSGYKPGVAGHELNPQIARDFARRLDLLAADMEDHHCFELADRLRQEAQQLRLSVR